MPKAKINKLIEPQLSIVRQEIIEGLMKPEKELYPKFFYNDIGSDIFEKICSLEEYYPSRVEMEVLQTYSEQMAKIICENCNPENCLLIEYGSGSSQKTRVLLDKLAQLGVYMPIDISEQALIHAIEKLESEYPNLEILGILADYTEELKLPKCDSKITKKVIFFPGTTIGNMAPTTAQDLLTKWANLVEGGGGMLVGIDRNKEPQVLHKAYNDSQSVTADFNLNILTRINEEIGANFDITKFQHYAFYNPRNSRIEMHLVSLVDQKVIVDGISVQFKQGESIKTEDSYKYSIEEFKRLAELAGWKVKQIWTDKNELYMMQYLTVE